jgi:F0F1-type ATP synthase assembly protein I
MACYGGPTVVIFYYAGSSFWINAALWLSLSFVFGMLYIFIATTIFAPPLELFRKKEDEFQSLGLTK